MIFLHRILSINCRTSVLLPWNRDKPAEFIRRSATALKKS
jgi:hypothetical protein